jgi:hypothetical protein
MNDTNRRLPTDDIEALLPWYAAGTLDVREMDQVEAALAADAELARRLDLVREEMTETIVLNDTLGAPSARVMEKLFSAIDQERRTMRRPAAGRLAGWLTATLSPSPRALAFAASAAVILIAAEAGVIAKLALQDQAPPGGVFLPQSLPPTGSIETGAFVKVKFSPQASMADVTGFLAGQNADIVGGPNDGVYRVRIGPEILSKAALDRQARDFQSASPIIVSAEAD